MSHPNPAPVYRVVEYDDPLNDDKIADGGPTSWLVEERKATTRSNGTIRLDRPFSDLAKRIFQPHARGSIFFMSESEAVVCFAQIQRSNIEAYARATARSNRAITWAARTHAQGIRIVGPT